MMTGAQQNKYVSQQCVKQNVSYTILFSKIYKLDWFESTQWIILISSQSSWMLDL